MKNEMSKSELNNKQTETKAKAPYTTIRLIPAHFRSAVTEGEMLLTNQKPEPENPDSRLIVRMESSSITIAEHA